MLNLFFSIWSVCFYHRFWTTFCIWILCIVSPCEFLKILYWSFILVLYDLNKCFDLMSKDNNFSEDRNNKQSPSFISTCKSMCTRMFYFFQLNGGYFALYGLMIPSILMNIFSAIFNEYSFFVFFLIVDSREDVYFLIYLK